MNNEKKYFKEELEKIRKEKAGLINMSLTSEDINRRRMLTHMEKLIIACNQLSEKYELMMKELRQLGVTEQDYADNGRAHGGLIRAKISEIKKGRGLLEERVKEVQLILQKLTKREKSKNFEKTLKNLKEKEEIINQMIIKGNYDSNQAILIEDQIREDREKLKKMDLENPGYLEEEKKGKKERGGRKVIYIYRLWIQWR